MIKEHYMSNTVNETYMEVMIKTASSIRRADVTGRHVLRPGYTSGQNEELPDAFPETAASGLCELVPAL